MHEYLKEMLPVAELVGEPNSVRMYVGDRVFGDDIQIEGRTMDGREYELRLTIREGEPDAGQS